MAPDVLARKLAYLYQLLDDLEPYRHVTLADLEANHYKIERIFELLVATATDILFHVLTERGTTPGSYREAFETAGKAGLLPQDLAQRLAQAAGMRNILVHRYEEIDYQILHQSIQPALNDFAQFALVFTPSAN